MALTTRLLIAIVDSKLLRHHLNDTSLFTSAASSQRNCPKGSPKEVRVMFPECLTTLVTYGCDLSRHQPFSKFWTDTATV